MEIKRWVRAINKCQAYRKVTDEDVLEFIYNNRPTENSELNFILSVIDEFYKISKEDELLMSF